MDVWVGANMFVDFESCYAARATADVDGLPVPVLRLEDLLQNKRASGQLKNLADVEKLS
jgi:hypothetical protein